MPTVTLNDIAAALRAHTPVPMPVNGNRKACVMVTLVEKDAVLHLMLTKRTDDVEHHKGQISFPGGMVDDGDASDTDTALRELDEETGIPRDRITVLGTLNDIHIPSGFIVTPVVGYIASLCELRTSAAEVAEVLLVPFEKFFDPSLRRLETRELKGMMRQVYFYDVWKEPVWGATAHIIKQFTDLLSAESTERR
ncbi:MAG: CoA pyrophosphatase [Bacteroidetes bacterium]|nr:CoA pyrophosphatase [Bacteroidota bacterium]